MITDFLIINALEPMYFKMRRTQTDEIKFTNKKGELLLFGWQIVRCFLNNNSVKIAPTMAIATIIVVISSLVQECDCLWHLLP